MLCSYFPGVYSLVDQAYRFVDSSIGREIHVEAGFFWKSDWAKQSYSMEVKKRTGKGEEMSVSPLNIRLVEATPSLDQPMCSGHLESVQILICTCGDIEFSYVDDGQVSPSPGHWTACPAAQLARSATAWGLRAPQKWHDCHPSGSLILPVRSVSAHDQS